MAKISGVLTDGAGNIINNCTIELYAKKTTSKVLTQTQAFQVANNGSYMMNVLPCDYEVKLIINGFPPKRLGTIQVFSDSKDGTLNDFLLNPAESEITPTILRDVIDAKNHAGKSAEKAANSERNSKTSETNAKISADNAKNSETKANNFAQSASASAATATNANTSAKSYSDSAKSSADSASSSATASRNSAQQSSNSANAAKVSENNAKTSEQEASKSAVNAKNWASTVDTSKLLKVLGNLSNTNINNLTGMNEGIYFQGRNAQAIVENGYPINQAGTLQVFKNGADGAGCCQIYITYKNSRQFIRNYLGAPKAWEPWVEQITTANINQYILVGDMRLMPFRRDELPFGWYIRNGDKYLLDSPQGRVLNSLSTNYKRDHNIKIQVINGKQHINVPTAFAADGRGYFERAVNGTNRQVGTIEGDAIRNIKGAIPNGEERAIIGHKNITKGERDGAISVYHSDNDWLQGGSREMKWAFFDFDASRVVPTADENRPMNIGMTPVIYLGV
ncbi:hypothetical protein A9G43_04055 [Gilliamella sp. Occ3-1]|uniref:prophage tail fiber N-terminal domain-containing protein n=1 Tax=Gilliamella sp. Occ3-1 TaxID=3120253 RepID=UPI00080DF096|nr:prophage tail fiber N-terminal domain-containing protein [Gilliamella apicola]OCG71934.1 hypothetical protein A9G43_04055 [Gilliamella apicola]